jgi:hypothetical protein
MSTRFDILGAKAACNGHATLHPGCRPGCAERSRLWREYMKTAARWGLETGDAARQREQFYSQAA